MHFNIQGLCNKCDNLNIHLSTHSVDVLCMTEHWLQESELLSTVIQNYKLISYFTRKNMQRGGVCIFAKTGINIDSLEYRHALEKHFEICIGVMTSKNGERVYVIVVYRTPDSDFGEFIHSLETLFYKIYNIKHRYIICGDVNINFLENSNNKHTLIDFFATYNIKHHINTATRITSSTKTCIDNVFSNYEVVDSIVQSSYLSDHTYQVCTIPLILDHETHARLSYKRNLNNINMQTFKYLIARENWQEMYNANNFNEKFSQFYSTLAYYFNYAFPVTKTKIKNANKKWFSPEIKSLHDQLCEMKKNEKMLQNPVYSAKYNEFKTLYKNTVKSFRTKINDERIIRSDNMMRESWKIIDECRNGNEKNSSISVFDNNIKVTYPADVANLFSNFLTSLSGSCPKPNVENINIKNFQHSMYLSPTTPTEIENIIRKTTTKPAAGIDEIHGIALRSVCKDISIPLSYLVNESFATGSFPDSLKVSKCIPIYKNKGSKYDVSNYRTIHLQSQLAKIFEFAFSSRLTDFVESFHLLSPSQNGFRHGKSTNTAIFDCLDLIYEALNSKTHIIALFYDLSRAFDMVDHQLLLNKLHGIGVRGVAHEWTRSYLCNRSQIVVVEGAKSEARNIDLGVPQGTILGPLFFIIFINDLTENCTTSNKTILYADDSNFLMYNKNIDSLINNCNRMSTEFTDWCQNNGLMLNINKTFYMKFYTKNINPDYNVLIKLYGKSIQGVNNIKFLGLTIDQKLTWEIHINNVCSKLSNVCYIIRTLKETVSSNVLRTLYFGLVQSTLQYGLLFWGSSAHLEKVFKIQKKILRCMAGVHPSTSCKPIFRKFNILTLPCLYISQLIMHIRANEHKFIKNNEVHTYNTRNNHLLHQPFSRLGVAQESPEYIGIKCYNSINLFDSTDSLNACKNKLNSYLIANCFYSVNEFLNFHCEDA